jgi:hypothetical protein
MSAFLMLVGLFVACMLFLWHVKHWIEQWHYGRMNRRTFERWRNER